MAEWLILQLPRGLDDQCGWMLADDSGAARSAPQIGTLAQAAGESAGRRVAAVVPSSDVLITEVELPQKAGVRAPQVVAYALEEQVAADIETLHFALGERDDATGRSAVAVVTRTLMNEWLAVLLAAGLAPVALCAEAALLPENPGHTVLLIDGDTLSLRRAGRAPLSLPAADLSAAIEASLGAEMATENIILYATARDWTRHAAEGELLRARCASLKVQLLESGALPLLAPQLASGRYINLLAGEYAPQRSTHSDWRRWRLAAVLALALFALHVAGLSLELIQQHRSERALDAAIGDVVRSALPGDPGTGSVRARIEQRLLAAQSQSAGSGLLSGLAALAQALSAAQGATLQAVSFREGGLDLKVRASDAASLERINQALRNDGWQAELTSGAANGATYEGRIQMHPPGYAKTARASR